MKLNRFLDILKFPLSTFLNKKIYFLLLTPYLISFEPDSTEETKNTISIGLGVGSFQSRDCSGKPIRENPFKDIAAGYSYIDGNMGLGVKTGIESYKKSVHSYPQDTYENRYDYYLNPYLILNYKYFGADVGISFNKYIGKDNNQVFGEKISPSANIRIGKFNSFYFSTSFWNNIPLWSGGGIFDAGVGFGSEESETRYWVGIGAIPYEPVLSVKTDIPILKNMLLNLEAQIGLREGFEGALSVGTSISF